MTDNEDRLRSPGDSPDGQQFLVLQQGGASTEWYATIHDTIEQAKQHIDECNEAAYKCAEPIPVPEVFTDIDDAEDVAEKIARAVAERILDTYLPKM